MPSLTFRTRLALATGIAVALTVILASVIAYAVVAHTMRGQLDDGLRSQVSGLREHPDRAHKMGEAARQRVLDKFTWPLVVKRCLEIYQS